MQVLQSYYVVRVVVVQKSSYKIQIYQGSALKIIVLAFIFLFNVVARFSELG